VLRETGRWKEREDHGGGVSRAIEGRSEDDGRHARGDGGFHDWRDVGRRLRFVAAGESELGERGSVFGAVHDERERSEEADEEGDQGANAEEGVEEEEGRRQREEFSTRLDVEEKREESGERKFGAE